MCQYPSQELHQDRRRILQAAAAEEAVLWELTTQVINAAYNLDAVLDMVRPSSLGNTCTCA